MTWFWVNLVQEERVATYRFFDEGLERVLGSSSTGAKSENMEGYSGVCAEATASFAALSNLVNAVEGLVKEQDKGHAAIAAIIRKVSDTLPTYEGVTSYWSCTYIYIYTLRGHGATLPRIPHTLLPLLPLRSLTRCCRYLGANRCSCRRRRSCR